MSYGQGRAAMGNIYCRVLLIINEEQISSAFPPSLSLTWKQLSVSGTHKVLPMCNQEGYR